ncbi:MAG: hypothetical protein ACI9XB_004153 [Gammaproteobacteria bacterium]|jgi:hypothetical protein
MKKYTTLLLSVLFSVTIYAQNFIPYLEDSLYGFSLPDGQLVIPASFDEVAFFNDTGLAAVRRGDYWSLVNKSGKVVLPFESEEPIALRYFNQDNRKATANFDASDISNKIARLRLAYINENGFRVLNLEDWEYSAVFETGFNYGMFASNKIYEYETIFRCGFLVAKSQSGISILDEEGKVIISKINQILILDENHFRYAKAKEAFYIYNKRNGTELKIPGRNIFPIPESELFIVSDFHDRIFHDREISTGRLFNRGNRKTIVINDAGELVIDSIYEMIRPYGKSELIAFKDSLWNLIDYDGELLKAGKYFNIYRKNKTKLLAQYTNGQWLYVDNDWNPLNKNSYTRIRNSNNQDLFYTHKGELATISDSNDQEIISYPAESINKIGSDLFQIKKGDKKGVIDSDKNIILPCIYDKIELRYRLFEVELDGKTGLYKKNGQEIIPPTYQKIRIQDEFHYKYYTLHQEEKKEFYNYDWQKVSSVSDHRRKHRLKSRVKKSKKPILEFQEEGKTYFYNQEEKLIGTTTRRSDCGYVLSDSSYLCLLSVDEEGKVEVLKPDGSYLFDSLDVLDQETRTTNLRTGLFSVLDKQGHNGIINHKSQWIIKPAAQLIYEINPNYILVQKNNLYFTYDHEGKLIQEEGFAILRGKFRKRELRYVGHIEEDKTYQVIRPETCGNETADTLTRRYTKGGYIDQYGQIKIPLEYSQTKVNGNSITLVKGYKEGERETFLFSRDGSELKLKTNYDFIRQLATNLNAFTLNGKEGLIDDSGKILLDTYYLKIHVLAKEYFFGGLTKDRHLDLLNNKGEVIVENIFDRLKQDMKSRSDYLYRLEDGYHLLYLKDGTFVLKPDGNIHMEIQSKTIYPLNLTHNYELLSAENKKTCQFFLKNEEEDGSYYYTDYEKKKVYKR